MIYTLYEATKILTRNNRNIISTYLSGLDTYETAEKFGCSQTFVIDSLTKIMSQEEHSFIYKKIYNNEKFFDK